MNREDAEALIDTLLRGAREVERSDYICYVKLNPSEARDCAIALKAALDGITCTQERLWDEGVERLMFEVHVPMNTTRRSDFPSVYDDAFVQSAWTGWFARAQRSSSGRADDREVITDAGSKPAAETYSKSIEFGEYMAKAAEQFIDAFDSLSMKQAFVDGAPHDESRPLKCDQLEQAREDALEAMRTLRSRIYEFRKRVPNTPAPAVPEVPTIERQILAAISAALASGQSPGDILDENSPIRDAIREVLK